MVIESKPILTGIVLSGAHGIFAIHTDEGVLRCTLRGKLKKAWATAHSAKPMGKPLRLQNQTNNPHPRPQNNAKPNPGEDSLPTRLAVGDYVKIRKIDATNGLIEEILPRRSELARKDAASAGQKQIQQTLLANLDQVIIVLATTQPEPHFGFLDRYLAICESAELIPLICINKADLPHDPQVEEEAALYRNLGYQVIFTSTQSNVGIDQLQLLLQNHTSLFTGPSGVGKSSLINILEPGMDLRTEVVSAATGKGRHTTTGSQLYPLSSGGWLADSAGIRALAAWNISPEDLAWNFIEFRPYLEECTYSDCSHIDEEGCAIIQAVKDEVINERRYRSYTRMYAEEERSSC